MKKHITLLIGILFFANVLCEVIDPPNPPTLVYDQTGFLSATEISHLKNKLETFSNETSNQIAIVVVKTLGDYDKAEYAVELGEKWGVGSAKFDNGIVVLIKPKYGNEKGEIFIATGYGLEGAIPDATAQRIIDNEIIPRFKEGQYYRGLDQATDVLMSLAKKEYSSAEYMEKSDSSVPVTPSAIGAVLFIIFFFGIGFFTRINRARRYSLGHSVPFWTAFWLVSSSRSHSGSYRGFSSGSSGGGFSGGGGFGGGSFGGGGAGGSW